MKRSLFPCFIIALAFAAWGCTHTEHILLEPDYSEMVNENTRLNMLDTLSFAPGRFSERNTGHDWFISFDKSRNTFNIYLERPIGEVLFDGVAALVCQSGHIWSTTDSSSFLIRVRLVDASAAIEDRFLWIAAPAAIEIALDFVERKSGNIVYTQLYQGNAEQTRFWGSLSFLGDSIGEAIVNCIREVGADEELVNALRESASEPE